MATEVTLPTGLKLSSDLAVYCREDDLLAISDLHLGYEASLQQQHVAIPRFQLKEMRDRLLRLLDRYKPSTILVNGDMKHEFGRNVGQEWDEVEEVLDILEDRSTSIIVRGNHDNFLQTILAKRDIVIVDSHVTQSGIEFVHGHRLSESHRFRIYGHEHPVIRIRDDVGALVTQPCFLHDEANGFMILPAFSPLASGTNVLSSTRAFMIEDIRGLDISSSRAYVVSETDILDFGILRDLESQVEVPERR